MTVLDKAGSNKQVNICVKTNFCLTEVLVRRRFTERESCLIAPNVIFEELHKRHKILRHWILRDRIPEIPSAVQFFSFLHSGVLFELTKESKIMLCITNATCRSYSVLRAPAGLDEYLYYKIWLFPEVLPVYAFKRTLHFVNDVRQYEYSDCTRGKRRTLPSM